MNSGINNKTPAYIYAKEFKLSKVLGNLQAYKVAVGDVSQAELDEASQEHGNNLGAVYGNLITKASLVENYKRKGIKNEISRETTRKRKKRKGIQRGKQDKKPVDEEYETPSVSFDGLDEPLPLPDCLQKDEEDQVSNFANEDSSENSEDESLDFFGLSNTRSEKAKPSEKPLARTPLKSCPSKEMLQPGDQDTKKFTTYKCWKCDRRGHLPEHCTVPQTSSGRCPKITSSGKISSSRPSVRTNLQDLYSQCRRLKHSADKNCNECGNTSNLAFCFECGLTVCDGRGHLIDHLLNFPGHTKIYSYKLQRLLKCSNSSCEVVDAKELLMCSQCLSKAFDKHYSLVNATWSYRGLKAITNAIACTEHFHWHRMNCYNSFEETLFSQEKMEQLRREGNGLLSEFFF